MKWRVFQEEAENVKLFGTQEISEYLIRYPDLSFLLLVMQATPAPAAVNLFPLTSSTDLFLKVFSTFLALRSFFRESDAFSEEIATSAAAAAASFAIIFGNY